MNWSTKRLLVNDDNISWPIQDFSDSIITDLILILQKRATGDVLLREVFKHVGLDEEKEYFGLSFQDNKGQVVSHAFVPFKIVLYFLHCFYCLTNCALFNCD